MDWFLYDNGPRHERVKSFCGWMARGKPWMGKNNNNLALYETRWNKTDFTTTLMWQLKIELA